MKYQPILTIPKHESKKPPQSLGTNRWDWFTLSD